MRCAMARCKSKNIPAVEVVSKNHSTTSHTIEISYRITKSKVKKGFFYIFIHNFDDYCTWVTSGEHSNVTGYRVGKSMLLVQDCPFGKGSEILE